MQHEQRQRPVALLEHEQPCITNLDEPTVHAAMLTGAGKVGAASIAGGRARRSGRSAAVSGEPDRMPRLALIVYVVIGVIVASQHSYYAHFGSLSQVLSAVVATALWPLILLGANLHLSLANL